jgi:hypothetical protein
VKEQVGFRFIKPLKAIHLHDASAYRLLNFLCLCADNKTGESHHGYSSIEYVTGLSEKTIRRATAMLVDMGLLSCKVHGSQQNTNLYKVDYDALLALAEKSQAGRREFIAAEQGKRAERQQRRRATVARKIPVTAAVSVDGKTPVCRQENSRDSGSVAGKFAVCVAGKFAVGTTKSNYEEKLTSKRTEETQDSGSIGGDKMNAEKLQQLEAEVATLSKLKAEAIHEKRLADYQTYNSQLQEAQGRLNFARNQIIRTAMDSAAAA